MKLLNFPGKLPCTHTRFNYLFNTALDRNIKCSNKTLPLHQKRNLWLELLYFIESVITPSISNEQNLRCSIFALVPFHVELACRVSIRSLSYGFNKYVCAPSPADKLKLSFILLFGGREEREEPSSLHNLFSHTEKILLCMLIWSSALTNQRFHFWSWKGWNFAFLQRFSGFYFCFSIVFLSFSRNNSANTISWAKAASYRVSIEETVQNPQVDHTTTPLTIQSRHFRQDLVMKRSKPHLTCCVC